MMFVPPARNFARGLAAKACTAAAASPARVYLNGLIGFPLLPDPRQLFLFYEPPGARSLSARVRLLNRGDDLRVRAAAADVAAHALAYLVVRKLPDGGRHVFRDVTHVAAPRLFEQPDGRADLARRAVAALEAVVLDEGRLHGVKLVALRQPFDGRHV